jgi:nucleoside-diphosphate-sugar epimerase
MKVLVTGASGGLGSKIILQLLKLGCEVIATSRSIEKIQTESFFNKVKFISYDINNSDDIDLYSYFGKPDTVIHTSWEKLDDYNSVMHLNTILENQKKFIFNLIDNGLKDLNCIGTCYEYGIIEGELSENIPPQPVLPYAQAKNELRKYIHSLSLFYSFSFKWIRVFYLFGQMKERKNLYTSLIQAIEKGDVVFNLSGGEQTRDFLSPNEAAENIIKISLQKQVLGEVNCCSGKPVKLKDFVKNFLIQNNYKIKLNWGYYPYLKYEPMNTWGGIKKLSECKDAFLSSFNTI